MAFEKYKPWGLFWEFYGMLKINVHALDSIFFTTMYVVLSVFFRQHSSLLLTVFYW